VADRWWPLRVPAVVAGLLLVERLLMDEVGTPATLLRELGDLGDARTSPVGSMLALMALLVEAIARLRPGGPGAPVAVHVPGPTGRIAGRLASVVTPVAARRLLDLLVGGALFAQATLAAMPGAPPHRWSALRLILPLRSSYACVASSR
jgi:hypothetical protein